jgi:hypothetical protein
MAVDPDKPFNTPENIEKERTKLLDEIKDVLKTQGVERPNPDELEHLVEIRVWNAPCYEFAHFTDEELAEASRQRTRRSTAGRGTMVIAALNHWRGEDKDIKLVWYRGGPTAQPNKWTGKWEYEVSKVKLAEALWPTLLRKIQLAMVTENAPRSAHHAGRQRRVPPGSTAPVSLIRPDRSAG